MSNGRRELGDMGNTPHRGEDASEEQAAQEAKDQNDLATKMLLDAKRGLLKTSFELKETHEELVTLLAGAKRFRDREGKAGVELFGQLLEGLESVRAEVNRSVEGFDSLQTQLNDAKTRESERAGRWEAREREQLVRAKEHQEERQRLDDELLRRMEEHLGQLPSARRGWLLSLLGGGLTGAATVAVMVPLLWLMSQEGPWGLVIGIAELGYLTP